MQLSEMYTKRESLAYHTDLIVRSYASHSQHEWTLAIALTLYSLSSNPSLIVNTHTTPGMSDHEAVTFSVNLTPARNRKPPHKIFQYKSANWNKLKDDINQLTTTYFHMNPNSRDINENWNLFGNNLSLVDRNIPSRNIKAKAHIPWITCEIIRMQRTRNKSHNKAKQTRRNGDWEKFRKLRRQASKAAAISYLDYLNTHIGESLKTTQNKSGHSSKEAKENALASPHCKQMAK